MCEHCSVYDLFRRPVNGGMRLKLLVEEYGRTIVTVICVAALIVFVLSYFFTVWHNVGAVEDGPKTNFYRNEEKRLAPVIQCTDFKAMTGEPVHFEDYVSAVDFDGRDISGQMQIANENGKQIQEIWDMPGIYRFVLSVKSSVTGKETRGKLLVLVEGKPQEGE